MTESKEEVFKEFQEQFKLNLTNKADEIHKKLTNHW